MVNGSRLGMGVEEGMGVGIAVVGTTVGGIEVGGTDVGATTTIVIGGGITAAGCSGATDGVYVGLGV